MDNLNNFPFVDEERARVWAELEAKRDWDKVDWSTEKQITELIEFIKRKGYGGDVREAIAQGFQKMIDTWIYQGMSEAEIVLARGKNETLSKRFGSIDQEIVEILNKIIYLSKDKVSKGKVGLDELTQEVKTAITGGSVAVVGINAVDTINVKDKAITVKKLNLEYNYARDLHFEIGSISSSDGSDTLSNNRIRTKNILHLDKGQKISFLDNRLSLGIFKYTSSGTYISSPNVWLKEYTAIQDEYLKLTIKKADNGEDISDYTSNIHEFMFINGDNRLIKKPDQIANNVIMPEHLAFDLSVKTSVDLIIFAGQSNMAGRGTASAAPEIKQGHGFEFRAISDPTKLYNIIEPFGVNENKEGGISEQTKTGSLVSSFANTWYKINKRPIVGVSASKGGSVISEWQVGQPYYEDVIQRFSIAEKWLTDNGYKINSKIFLWLQGETDGVNKTAKETYKELVLQLKNNILKQGFDQFHMIRIGQWNGDSQSHEEIIKAQTELGEMEKDITLVSLSLATLTDQMKDTQHFNQYALNLIGEESATNSSFAINNYKQPIDYDHYYKKIFFPQIN
ncbi:sialate O-acetylesterase [Facklamia sp. P13064]|uniref:sialate O-acetylesterase n=1 Tax=Facklamia sp. P13064 TaxID=3421953 RepID=UPI003D16F783